MEAKQQQIKTPAGDFKRGLYHGASIGLGYFAVAAAFGMLAAGVGLTPELALLISVTNLTSAGQFAGLALIGAGGSLIEIAATVFVINIRYVPLSNTFNAMLKRIVDIFGALVVRQGTDQESAVGYCGCDGEGGL